MIILISMVNHIKWKTYFILSLILSELVLRVHVKGTLKYENFGTGKNVNV